MLVASPSEQKLPYFLLKAIVLKTLIVLKCIKDLAAILAM